jgi:hypothetical protein
MPQTLYGAPIEMPPPKSGVLTFKTVSVGLVQNDSPPNLPPGATPSAQNVLAREGVLEPRYRLATTPSGATNLLQDVVLGLGEYVKTDGTRYPYAISAQTLVYGNGGTWNAVTYEGDDPPVGGTVDYMDSVVAYDPDLDENVLVWVNGVNAAYRWDGSSTTYGSQLNAPIAKTLSVYDSRVVYGNVNGYVQRVMYSEKGAPSITTAPTGGFEDEMDARGSLQRLMTDGERSLAFFEHEVWFGYKLDFPFNLTYQPLDRTVGTGSPWAVCQTPKGVFFLGDNYQPYIVPRGGVPQPIGQAIWKTLRDGIDNPERATAEYNPDLGEVLLAYPIAGSGRCSRGLSINIETGAWTPQTFGTPLTRLAVASVIGSTATTWGNLVGSWASQTMTWEQMGGVVNQRAMYAGCSSGTVATFTASATSDMGSLVESQYLAVIPNDDPTRKLYVREVRLDYRSASASSLTLRMSKDFGTTYSQSVAVALPVAALSAQTTVFVGLEAQYPCIQFQHDAGHRFALQRCEAVVTPMGRG